MAQKLDTAMLAAYLEGFDPFYNRPAQEKSTMKMCFQCGDDFTPSGNGIDNLCPTCAGSSSVDRELTGITCDICHDDWSYCPQHEAQAREIIAARHAK